MERDSTNSLEQGMKHQSIAIDGPAGAGKSTLARALARELGFLYVDTGAIYRTVALEVLRTGGDPADTDRYPMLANLDIRMDYGPDGEQRMFLDGEDVSQRYSGTSGIRFYVQGVGHSGCAGLSCWTVQRRQAREHDVVMDGRDIGTVVLPQADVKIFFTAAAEARARRRLLELQQRGQQADFDTILHDIILRDEQDEHRPIAPLRRAEDAVLLDTTQLNLEQSLQQLLHLVKEKIDL